jgi:hypothetical protein
LPEDDHLRFDQILRRVVEKSREGARFNAECRAAIKGRPRDEARAILVEQYERFGRQPLGQPLLDRKLDMLLTPSTVSSRVSDVVDSTSTLIGAGIRLKRMFQNSTHDDPIQHQEADLHVMPDLHQTVPVTLTDDAQSWLGQVELTGLFAFRDISMIAVTIEPSAARDDGGTLHVLVNGRLAGVLPDADSSRYWEVIQRGPSNALATLSSYGLRSRDEQDLWRLDMGLPKTVRPTYPFNGRSGEVPGT